MTEEIKEILDYIDDRIIPNEKWDKIKDYITNLQQLYENGLKINLNENKYRTELEDKYVVLQQENEKLKEELKNRPIVDFTFDVYKELEDYKSRCEKAVEYIKEHIRIDDEYPSYMEMLVEEKNELLNILNGSDEK